MEQLHFTTSNEFSADFVHIFDLKSVFVKNFDKVNARLKFFDNYYYKIHKKYQHIEFKEYSFSEDLKEIKILNNNY